MLPVTLEPAPPIPQVRVADFAPPAEPSCDLVGDAPAGAEEDRCRRVAVAGDVVAWCGSTRRLWHRGSPRLTVDDPRPCDRVEIQGDRVLFAMYEEIEIRDVATGEVVRTLSRAAAALAHAPMSAPVETPAVAFTGDRLFQIDFPRVTAWDGERVRWSRWNERSTDMEDSIPNDDAFVHAALAGERLFVSRSADAVVVLDAGTGDAIAELRGPSGRPRVFPADDGRSFVWIGDGAPPLRYDVPEAPAPLGGDEDARVVGNGGDLVGGTLRVGDAAVEVGGDVYDWRIAGDGGRVAIARWQGDVEVYDVTSGRVARRVAGVFAPPSHPPTSFALSDDGRWLAVASATDLRLLAVDDPAADLLVGGVRVSAFQPGAHAIAVAEGEGVRLWDPDARVDRWRVPDLGLDRPAASLVFDGDTLVVASEDEVNRVDVRTGIARVLPDRVEVPTEPSPTVTRLAVRDGALVVLTETEAVAWDLASLRPAPTDRIAGREPSVRPPCEGGPAYGLERGTASVARDGRRLATGGDDGLVRVWEPDTCRLLTVLATGDDATVTALAWLPDGRLASGDARGLVHLWDVAASRRVAVLSADTRWAVWTDGQVARGALRP
ncbi:MAG: WD40 repeat domain-containing protein [Myxococcota bacterium]